VSQDSKKQTGQGRSGQEENEGPSFDGEEKVAEPFRSIVQETISPLETNEKRTESTSYDQPEAANQVLQKGNLPSEGEPKEAVSVAEAIDSSKKKQKEEKGSGRSVREGSEDLGREERATEPISSFTDKAHDPSDAKTTEQKQETSADQEEAASQVLEKEGSSSEAETLAFAVETESHKQKKKRGKSKSKSGRDESNEQGDHHDRDTTKAMETDRENVEVQTKEVPEVPSKEDADKLSTMTVSQKDQIQSVDETKRTSERDSKALDQPDVSIEKTLEQEEHPDDALMRDEESSLKIPQSESETVGNEQDSKALEQPKNPEQEERVGDVESSLPREDESTREIPQKASEEVDTATRQKDELRSALKSKNFASSALSSFPSERYHGYDIRLVPVVRPLEAGHEWKEAVEAIEALQASILEVQLELHSAKEQKPASSSPPADQTNLEDRLADVRNDLAAARNLATNASASTEDEDTRKLIEEYLSFLECSLSELSTRAAERNDLIRLWRDAKRSMAEARNSLDELEAAFAEIKDTDALSGEKAGELTELTRSCAALSTKLDSLRSRCEAPSSSPSGQALGDRLLDGLADIAAKLHALQAKASQSL
jgi:hypothetical protein